MKTQKTVAAFDPENADLPQKIRDYGLTKSEWHALKTLYPNGSNNGILLVVSYCKARGLDPFKKPCHIVPSRTKNKQTGQWETSESIYPGIYELRTTAARTGLYAGMDEQTGPSIEYLGVTAPEWIKITIKKSLGTNPVTGELRIGEISHVARFVEEAKTKKDYKSGEFGLNDMWTRRPYAMLSKVAEAGALRKAFPDELGGEMTAEEMHEPMQLTPEPASETIEHEHDRDEDSEIPEALVGLIENLNQKEPKK